MTQITEAELFAAIDGLETDIMPRRFTTIEYKALEYARSRGVQWIKLTEWFNQTFGKSFKSAQLAHKFQHERNQYGCGE
jgi:hypothetical protein